MRKAGRVHTALRMLLLVLAFTSLTGFMNDDGYKTAAARIQAIFIWNFTRHIEWPDSYKEGDFTIALMGNAHLKDELARMAKMKKVGERNIRIIPMTPLMPVPKCNMLYVSPGHSNQIERLRKELEYRPTLLITEKNGLANEGAMINFVVINNKQKFELNVATAEKHNLKVSSDLESLAILVK